MAQIKFLAVNTEQLSKATDILHLADLGFYQTRFTSHQYFSTPTSDKEILTCILTLLEESGIKAIIQDTLSDLI